MDIDHKSNVKDAAEEVPMLSHQQQHDTDDELTMKDLMILIRMQQEEQKRDRELLVQLLKKQAQQEDVIKKPLVSTEPTYRRTTMYLPRVNDRTSMGGAANLENSVISDNAEIWDGDHGNDNAEEDDDEQGVSVMRGQNMKKLSSMKVKEPPVFQGEASSDVTRWLELIEDFMSCFTEDEVIKVQKAMLYLGEGPRIFVKTAEQEAKKEGRPFMWKDVKKTLLECFLPTITEDIARMRLSTLKQTGTVWEYTAEFQKLDHYIVKSDAADRIDRYRRGLKEQIQRMWLQQSTLQSVTMATNDGGKTLVNAHGAITKLTQAIAYAVQLEAAINQYRELTKTVTYPNRYPVRRASMNLIVGSNGATSKVLDNDWTGMENAESEPGARDVDGNLNSVSDARPKPAKPQGMTEEKYNRLIREKRCLSCEKVGHIRAKCRTKQQVGAQNKAGSITPSTDNQTKDQAPRQ
jgi:hypothetical protein